MNARLLDWPSTVVKFPIAIRRLPSGATAVLHTWEPPVLSGSTPVMALAMNRVFSPVVGFSSRSFAPKLPATMRRPLDR
jgi:hypothetical protein